MTLNELLTKQNVITKIMLKDGDKELSKELKVKIMRLRMMYNKIKKAFDTEVQEFANELITNEFKTLDAKANKTEEEIRKHSEMLTAFNAEYQEFIAQKGKEAVQDIDDSFTEEDYFEIIEVNAGNDVEINGRTIAAVDFLEAFCELFVK